MSTENTQPSQAPEFPFLFGGTFIEAHHTRADQLSVTIFPFLFGGTFIEAGGQAGYSKSAPGFPFLFGGTFIEAARVYLL